MSRNPREPVGMYQAGPRTRRSLLIWLSGADADTLSRAGRDRGKFVGLGGVVLTTATMAAVASTIAVRMAGQTSWAVAAIFGLLWGLGIMNLDRWLVSAGQRQKKWWMNLGVVIPRFLVALIVGAVISTPLVLQIFNREIEAELDLIHQQRVDQHQQDLLRDARFVSIPEREANVARLQRIVDGTEPASSVDQDPAVAALLAEYNNLDKQYVAAQALATCEFDGRCGTGQVGNGPAYRQKQQVA